MPSIVVENVTRLWGETAAVRDVSFAVEAGSLVALLGPSGCGKSTTLRLIAGLDIPTSGRILIGDRDVTQMAPAKRGISMVFQSYALFPHLTVAENIIFGLRVRKVARGERDERLSKVAHLLGLQTLLSRKPSQLSGGQQQRVALARAVVAEAQVCLMDEPLSNLDAQLRLEMRREIRALQQRLGMTMIYVTHDQVEAMTMADRIILMRNGQIEQNGSPSDLYTLPATTFAARFIGTPPMNVVPGGAVANLPIAPTLLGKRSADEVSIGVRPEAVHLDPAGIPAELVAAEYLGADTLLETRMAGVPFVARVAGKTDAKAGATLHFLWSPEDQHLFDRASEQRLV